MDRGAHVRQLSRFRTTRTNSSGIRTASTVSCQNPAGSGVAEFLISAPDMSLPRQVLPGEFYLITRRCQQRQFLLRPDTATNNAFTYCLIEAALQTLHRIARRTAPDHAAPPPHRPAPNIGRVAPRTEPRTGRPRTGRPRWPTPCASEPAPPSATSRSRPGSSASSSRADPRRKCRHFTPALRRRRTERQLPHASIADAPAPAALYSAS
jgi:hypothetical protein